MSRATDVVVIGGGLAGLAAAAYLGRAGRRVTVLEKAGAPGGRAATQKKSGFSLNLGPHALYLGGQARPILAELGITPKGRMPSVSGGYAVRGGQIHTLPTGPLSMLTSGLLPLSAKLEIGRVLARVGSLDAAAHRDLGARAWIGRYVRSPGAQELLEALCRVSTYAADLDRMSAEVAIHQLQIVTKANVMYLDDGWQTLVDGLRGAALAAGAAIVTDARAEAIAITGGAVTGVRLAGGERIDAAAAVIAASPSAASALVPGHADLAAWAERSIPVRAACLDLALASLPAPRATFGVGLDRPLYFSVHSAAAALAPAGGAVIHVAEYLTDGRKGDEAALEALCDRLQPGWRDVVVERRFMPSLTVYNALCTAEMGGFAGRPGPAVPGVDGLFVAGDWVGPEGLLADASLASARRAAELAGTTRAARLAA